MKEQIIKILERENTDQVKSYANYIQRLFLEVDKMGKLKNPWIQHRKAQEFCDYFIKVKEQGLVFDGKHITLQSTGISYDYVAYKNKMLLAYPETKIDISVVNDGDIFTFSKENGKVNYEHVISDPFEDNKKIIGAYCIIKNLRGEFITLLNRQEIEKHKRVAKTSYIWDAWFKEMVLKTVIKKGVKYHFEDVFENIKELDNENEDLELLAIKPEKLDLIEKTKQDLAEIKDIETLRRYYSENVGNGKEVAKLITDHSQKIKELIQSNLKQ